VITVGGKRCRLSRFRCKWGSLLFLESHRVVLERCRNICTLIRMVAGGVASAVNVASTVRTEASVMTCEVFRCPSFAILVLLLLLQTRNVACSRIFSFFPMPGVYSHILFNSAIARIFSVGDVRASSCSRVYGGGGAMLVVSRN
jgi:hypothetical protein